MKKIPAIIFLIAELFISFNSSSQDSQQWVARYNGLQNNYDFAEAMALDSFGNIYVTGAVNGFGICDFATIKYNSSGQQLWIVFYNGTGDSSDTPRCLAVDLDGNILVSGTSFGNGTGLDFVTIKYDTSGRQVWIQRYSLPDDNFVSCMELDDSNNVYVAGNTNNYSHIIKYSSLGIQQFTVNFPGRYISSIKTDKKQSVYATGLLFSNGSADCFTIKFDSEGVQQWVQTYNGAANLFDNSNSMTLDNSLNVYITGYSQAGPVNAECITIKYDNAGNQLWIRRYNESDTVIWNEGMDITTDDFNNIYIAGETVNQISSTDFLTIKYTSEGELQWAASYSGPGNNFDGAYFVKTDYAGNVYSAGNSEVGFVKSDYTVVKYNPAGIFQWVERYHVPNPGNSYSSEVLLDKYNNIYITGGSTLNGFVDGYDFATIKYSQSIGIKPISNQNPAEFSLYQNYPNPFNPATKIKFDVPTANINLSEAKGLDIKLVVYDNLGREAATLVNEQLQPGTYEIEWNAVNFSSGIYYYKLISKEFIVTKKMVLLK